MPLCSFPSSPALAAVRFAAPSLGVGRSGVFSPLEAIRREVEREVATRADLVLAVEGEAVPMPEAFVRLQSMARRGTGSDQLWSALVDQARGEGGVWVTLALGAALPVLVWKCARHSAGTVERAEMEAAAVAGFVEELLIGQLSETGLLAHLSRAANRAAQRQVDSAVRCRVRTCSPEHSAESTCDGPGHAAAGHPDFALAALVRERVLTMSEAELIGRHRLEGVALKQIAEERGWYPMQASRALRRAELRAASALKERISRNG